MMNTQEICKAMFDERTKNNSSNPFFPNAARDLLAAILVSIIRIAEGDKNFINENFYNNRIKEYLDASSSDTICDLFDGFQDMQSRNELHRG